MPIAALADIHGNLPALEAVLADPRLAEADRIVVLGDVVTGTFPAETLDRVLALGDRARILRGNADRLALEDPHAWAMLGPDVELLRTEYDVEAAAAAVLASGQPNTAEAAGVLLRPPSPEEATAEWEGSRLRS